MKRGSIRFNPTEDLATISRHFLRIKSMSLQKVSGKISHSAPIWAKWEEWACPAMLFR